MKKSFIILLLICLCLSYHIIAQEAKVTTGYKHGTLLLIGGGKTHEGIMKEFRKLAGGDSAKIVVIPTASVLSDTLDPSGIKSYFKRLGFNNVTVLHTRDSAKANRGDFIKPITTATGIFFTGGRQWRIADGFLNTKAHEEMFKLLDRGGVIAGSSAGATIQGSYLARGDTKNNQIMMGDHEVGLGFITNVAIDQHVIARNRQFDMFDILKNKPHLLGIGIDEETAIKVKANTFEVIGKSYVIIYDNSFWSREGTAQKTVPNKNNRFYFLKHGDLYNLKERKVIQQ